MHEIRMPPGRRPAVLRLLLAGALLAAGLALAAANAFARPLPHRPDFRLPFPCGSQISLTTYVGHNPDDKKVDMFRAGWPTGSPILASAGGLVHEQFYPGGIEIDHGHGWFTVYLHMSWHVPPGTRVKRGDRIGTMGSVGTGVPHLHYEQLYHPGFHDGDTGDMVRPVIQGRGPIKMEPNHPITMRSTNSCLHSAPKPPVTHKPRPHGSRSWVTTFAAAPGHATPGGRVTGTLNPGRNYVYCKALGPTVRVGRAHNHWWLKTDLDVGPANQWVSAYYLKKWGNDVAKDDRGRPIRTCRSAPRSAPGRAKYWVTTFAAAPGRAAPGGKRTGTLHAGRNYVYCKALGPTVRVGRAHNHWWLKTDLDVGPANQWVSAYYLEKWGNDVAKDDRGRAIPTCG